MTKVEAIEKVLEDNGGIATWGIIYNQIEKYYPEAKRSEEWQAGIRGVLYREIKNKKKFRMFDAGIISLYDYDETKQVLDEDRSYVTEKTIQALIRIGQDKFRKNLLKILKFCPITNVDDKRILNASHIKPWAISNNTERLDVYNGFIFSPTIDKLFDYGFISFENNKKIIVSNSLSDRNLKIIGLERNKIYHKMPIDNRINYLEYHRNIIFDKRFKTKAKAL